MPSPNHNELLSRRAFLGALGGSFLLAACTSSPSRSGSASSASPKPSSPTASSSNGNGSPSSSSPPEPTPSTASATAPAANLPATTPWSARPGEVRPDVKGRAVKLVEAVATWPPGGEGVAAARARIAALGLDPALADSFGALLGSGTAAVAQVVDAQYGGILTSSSSVLVVVNQWRAQPDGSTTAGGTTLDIRLVAAQPQWRVTEVHPAAPAAPSDALPTPASQALSNTRLHLPYAARADVLGNSISGTVLGLLQALSQQLVADVSILRSGHPLFVFGTSRPSDHPKGRAVDVWAIDGKPLVLPENHGLAVGLMRFAVAHGAYNVGGPVLLSGPAYFSDQTHQDHVHIGFTS